jgi:hypothetical protein
LENVNYKFRLTFRRSCRQEHTWPVPCSTRFTRKVYTRCDRDERSLQFVYACVSSSEATYRKACA